MLPWSSLFQMRSTFKSTGAEYSRSPSTVGGFIHQLKTLGDETKVPQRELCLQTAFSLGAAASLLPGSAACRPTLRVWDLPVPQFLRISRQAGRQVGTQTDDGSIERYASIHPMSSGSSEHPNALTPITLQLLSKGEIKLLFTWLFPHHTNTTSQSFTKIRRHVSLLRLS